MSQATVTLADLVPDLTDAARQRSIVGWPPDVFTLTSRALRTTGAYRFATNHGDKPPWPPVEEWKTELQQEALQWWSYVLGRELTIRWGGGDEPHTVAVEEIGEIETFRTELEKLRANAATPLDELTFIGGSDREEKRRSEVSQALLKLHALADQTCAGLGIPNGSPHRTLANYLANCLLTETGSLSTLPRSEGLVLPKMRTADVGLTLRSFSHHLTYHRSEVEVVWRTMPWANIDENTLNVLVLPWPFEVDATEFRPHPSLGRSRSVSSARFFEYASHRTLAPKLVLEYLKRAREQVGRIHVLVLPEAAVSDDEMSALRDALVEQAERTTDIPMVIAGVRTGLSQGDDESVVSGRNRVELSSYFGAKWYTLSQDKHHRWKLDEPQIRQYGLGGVLSGGQNWWEAIDIPNRKLSFLVPNGWLALTPLICEDLARMDPISELVRGVGPTMVIALLFDGPQMRERWPARYASVLTDDPGSSVLSVTSLGMSKRSRLVGHSTKETQKTLGKAIVALWNDEIHGFHEVDLSSEQEGREDGEHEAAVLTVSAQWTEEFTADGRSDGGAAARFALNGVTPIHVDRETVKSLRAEDPTRRTDSGAGASAHPGEADGRRGPEQGLPESRRLGGRNLLEVATFTYLVDSVLDASPADRETVLGWAIAQDGVPARPGDATSGSLAHVFEVLERRSPFRGSDRRGTGQAREQTDEYRLAVRLLGERVESAQVEADAAAKDLVSNGELEAIPGCYGWPARRLLYKALHRQCGTRLRYLVENLPEAPADLSQLEPLGLQRLEEDVERREACRISFGTDQSLMWAIHHRVAYLRRQGRMSSPWACLMEDVERLLSLQVPPWLRVLGLSKSRRRELELETERKSETRKGKSE